MNEATDDMKPEYDFSKGERGRYADRMEQGFSTPVTRGEQPPTGVVEIFRDADGLWRWRLKAVDGLVIADSHQGYTTEEHCLSSVDALYHSMNRVKTINTEAA